MQVCVDLGAGVDRTLCDRFDVSMHSSSRTQRARPSCSGSMEVRCMRRYAWRFKAHAHTVWCVMAGNTCTGNFRPGLNVATLQFLLRDSTVTITYRAMDLDSACGCGCVRCRTCTCGGSPSSVVSQRWPCVSLKWTAATRPRFSMAPCASYHVCTRCLCLTNLSTTTAQVPHQGAFVSCNARQAACQVGAEVQANKCGKRACKQYEHMWQRLCSCVLCSTRSYPHAVQRTTAVCCQHYHHVCFAQWQAARPGAEAAAARSRNATGLVRPATAGATSTPYGGRLI